MFRDNLLVLPSDMGLGEGTVLSSVTLVDVVDVAVCIIGWLSSGTRHCCSSLCSGNVSGNEWREWRELRRLR
jgi:hypothetical protein